MDDMESIWQRRWTVSACPPFPFSKKEVTIHEDFGNDDAGLGSTVWDPSFGLAELFNDLQLENSRVNTSIATASLLEVVGKRDGLWWENQTVLELGSGLGLLGIIMFYLGANVTVSDRGETMLQLLADNVSSNLGPSCTCNAKPLKHWCKNNQTLSILPLDWTIPSTTPSKYNIIVASECLYHIEMVQPLLSTAHYHSNPDTIFFLCGIIGEPPVEQEFQKVYPTYFTLVHIIPSIRSDRHVYVFKPR